MPHTKSEYRKLVGLLDTLIDEVGEDESYPLASFMEVVGIMIENNDDEHVPELAVEWSAGLRYRATGSKIQPYIALIKYPYLARD